MHWACDARHYPDPAYTVLRHPLAQFHGVDGWRVVLAASASEFIHRITAWVAQRGGESVRMPKHAYGDYAQAASVWGLAVDHAGPAALQWHADPSSPLGQSVPQAEHSSFIDTQVLDCAYEPLGLTGVRAACAIAPLQAQASVDAINRLRASWPLGAHGVALLQSRVTLRHWKQRQISVLQGRGWTCLPSEANFFGARPLGGAPAADLGVALAPLRSHGIKLRDATSFGLPGHVRVSVQAPVAQAALARAWTQWKEAV